MQVISVLRQAPNLSDKPPEVVKAVSLHTELGFTPETQESEEISTIPDAEAPHGGTGRGLKWDTSVAQEDGDSAQRMHEVSVCVVLHSVCRSGRVCSYVCACMCLFSGGLYNYAASVAMDDEDGVQLGLHVKPLFHNSIFPRCSAPKCRQLMQTMHEHMMKRMAVHPGLCLPVSFRC